MVQRIRRFFQNLFIQRSEQDRVEIAVRNTLERYDETFQLLQEYDQGTQRATDALARPTNMRAYLQERGLRS